MPGVVSVGVLWDGFACSYGFGVSGDFGVLVVLNFGSAGFRLEAWDFLRGRLRWASLGVVCFGLGEFGFVGLGGFRC